MYVPVSRNYHLHILQVQLSPFHSLIRLRKTVKEEESFIKLGRLFQIRLPLKANELVPYVVDTALGRFTNILFLRLYGILFVEKMSHNNLAFFLFIVL